MAHTVRTWSHHPEKAKGLELVHVVAAIYFMYTVAVLASIAYPAMRKWTLVTVISLHLGGLVGSICTTDDGMYGLVTRYLGSTGVAVYMLVDVLQVLVLAGLLAGRSVEDAGIVIVLVGCALCGYKLKRSLAQRREM
jgi:hypothetical protein